MGEMIRTEHVAYSFTMICVEQGVPYWIYVDNGGEFKWIEMTNDLTRLARAERVQQAGVIPQLRDQSELRSEEHTSELLSLMRNSYAVFCLKKKKQEITK